MKQDQHIIVCAESPQAAEKLLEVARSLAQKLRKGIVLLSCAQGAESWIQAYGVPYASLHGDWRTVIQGLPTALGGILALALVDHSAPRTSITHPKTLLREFRDCKIAYLCIPAFNSQVSTFNFQHCVLTLTHRREGKEKLLWASYLARFLQSRITIAHPNYRDADLRMRWTNNMRFVDKIFSPLGIQYSTAILSRSTRVDQTALDELQPNILVTRATDTRDRDLFDWFSPSAELQLLSHPSHTPILLLNPRDDLYILCD